MYRGDGAYIRTKYDSNNLTTSAEYKFGGVTEKTTYEYQADKDNAPYKASFTNGSSSVIEYDGLGRAYRTAALSAPGHFVFMETYSYLNNPSDANKTSGIVSKIDYTNNLGSFSYKYDSRGNITEETLSDITVNSYHYDSLNRLTRVDSESEGKTHIYAYDGSGNILSDTVYTCILNSEPLENKTLIETINYTYGDSDWGDMLTAYNGKAITYDNIGNPLTYDGQSFTWLGRRMMSYTGRGVTTNYKYNSDGIRTTKTTGTTATTFFLNGSTILAQKTGNTVIPFYYNAAGDRVGFKYNGEMYFYVKNLQGDVIKIVNSAKAVVGEYQYDSWGKILNLDSLTDIAKVNPFRYRGYYYDTESNLYYLNSRYYNPEWGRFINADGIVVGVGGNVNGYNLFVYCYNNPINRQDQKGLYGDIFSKGTLFLKQTITKIIFKKDCFDCMIEYNTSFDKLTKDHHTESLPLLSCTAIDFTLSTTTTILHTESNAKICIYDDYGFKSGYSEAKYGITVKDRNQLPVDICVSTMLYMNYRQFVTQNIYIGIDLNIRGFGIIIGYESDHSSIELEMQMDYIYFAFAPAWSPAPAFAY